MRYVILYAHPNPKSFNHAILARVEANLKRDRKEYVVRDLYALNFKPVLEPADFVAMGGGSVRPDVAEEQRHIAAADKLIVIHPIWWFGMPAMLKGYIDRVFTGGFAYAYTAKGVEGLLKGKRAIILNTPSNPTGSAYTRDELASLGNVLTKHNVAIISDEIYEKLIYGKEHISLASIGSMAERTITINGFSKAYAMTGWRLGYAVAPKPIIKAMSKVQQHSVSQATTFAMWGAVAALKGDQKCVENMRSEFDKRRKFMMAELGKMGYTCAPADGAFYAFVKVAGDDNKIATDWLEKGHVAATPGSSFYAPGWIRLSYAASMERLKEAMDRIKRVGGKL